MDPHPPLRASALGKLSCPRLGRRSARQRLFKALDDMADRPGLWLAAPPGAGKTTLAATWLQQLGDPVLWLQADAGDADPATFMRWLDELWQPQLSRAVDLPAPGSEDLFDLPGWMRRRLRTLLPLLPERWTLVIDNHQELPADSPLQAALAAALAELPVGARWMFISRHLPPPAFSAALVRQQLGLLGAEAMRLDRSETLALIQLHGRSESILEALAPAQGWAAGMTLMLLGQPRAAHLPALDAKDRLFDYFAEEVLARMLASEQQALCLLAQLPSTTAELAVAMSGDDRVPALLDRLVVSGLFVDRREAEQPVYSLHALFSEFLRRRHEHIAPPGDVREARVRAGRLLLVAGDTDAGLAQLLAAEAWDECEAAVVHHVPAFLSGGRLQALRQTIAALPAEAGERLAYWRGLAALDTDPAVALADAQVAHLSARAAADVPAQLAALALAASALVAMGRLHELDRWIDALDALGDGALAALEDRGLELRVVPGLVAALVFHRPWHALTTDLADRAERLLHHHAATSQRLLLGPLAFHFLWRGDMDRLQRIVMRIDELCDTGLAAPAALMRWWGVGILVKTLTGQVASAQQDLRRMLDLVASEPLLAPQQASAQLQGVFVALAHADRAMARQHLDAAARTMHPDNALDRTVYEHQHAMVALMEEDRPAALRLARAAVVSGRRSGFAVREHVALICHALAAAHSEQTDEAQHVLAQVRNHPLQAICPWHQWISGCVAAYSALRRGDTLEAVEELRAAMRLSARFGFRLGPQLLVITEMMPRLLALALAQDIEPDAARGLIQRHRLTAPPEADHRWPWPVRVRVLGSLEVEVDGAPLPPSRKESRRLLELLQLIAAHGTAPLPLDRVADALWPDAEGDAARNALDNALHRLRKTLGCDDCIVLRQGALSLNAQRCWTDVDAVAHGLDSLPGCPPAQLPARLHGLRQIYCAPLLPDAELPLIVARRRLLQRQMHTAVESAADRLDQAGLLHEARQARQAWADVETSTSTRSGRV